MFLSLTGGTQSLLSDGSDGKEHREIRYCLQSLFWNSFEYEGAREGGTWAIQYHLELQAVVFTKEKKNNWSVGR